MNNDCKSISILYEASRRDFLKQVGGAIGAAATATGPMKAVAATAAPIKAAVSSILPKMVYDITRALTSDDIYEIVETFLLAKDVEVTDNKITKSVESLRKMLSNGKLPNDSVLIDSILAHHRDMHSIMSRTLTTVYDASYDASEIASDEEIGEAERMNNDIEDYVESETDGNIGDYMDHIRGLLPPGDIIYNGKVLVPMDKLVKRGIFLPAAEVEKYALSELSIMRDNIADHEKWLQHTADKTQKIADAESSIKDTHADLGQRRPSAWYESTKI
jgi:Arc/MetJ-type ribon-helix-helix transcriptional regulator